MGLFGLFKPQKENYALSLDIGTEFVKALIFKIKGEKGYVVGAGRARQKLSDMQGGAVTDIQGVIQNCQMALEEAQNQAKERAVQTIIGIAGELVKGTTTTVKYERDDPKSQITLNELRKIVEQVQERAFEKTRSQLAWETGHREIDVKLVNASIVDVKIDGLKVTNPLGFQGKEVEVGIFNAFAPIVHLGALETIANALDLDLLSITAEPYAVARSVGLEEKPDFSAIFMDIGGGTTDIAVVRNGGVEGTKMFALGGRAFTRRISETLGLSFEQAEDLKIKYSTGKNIPQETKTKIQEALSKDAGVWLSGVELTLGEFPLDLLPSKILLCGGGSELPEIKQVLSSSTWISRLPFAKPPSIRFLKPEEVVNIKDETGQLKNPSDITPMALANLAIDLAGEETIVEGMLSRVVKALKT
jgi:cell division protein FtsA